MAGSDVPPWRTMIFEGGQFFGALAAVADASLPADGGRVVAELDVVAVEVPVEGELSQFAEVTFFLRGFAGAGFLGEDGCCAAAGFEDDCELGCD
jgi:hypothetical protein